MQTERIFGRDTRLILSLSGQILRQVSKIKSFSGEFKIDIVKEGYLGHVAPLGDSIYQGFEGKLEWDWSDDDVFAVYQKLTDAAKNRLVSPSLNITTSFLFSNGQRKRMQLSNCSHGSLPVNIGGRDKYVSSALDIYCGTDIVFL